MTIHTDLTRLEAETASRVASLPAAALRSSGGCQG